MLRLRKSQLGVVTIQLQYKDEGHYVRVLVNGEAAGWYSKNNIEKWINVLQGNSAEDVTVEKDGDIIILWNERSENKSTFGSLRITNEVKDKLLPELKAQNKTNLLKDQQLTLLPEEEI